MNDVKFTVTEPLCRASGRFFIMTGEAADRWADNVNAQNELDIDIYANTYGIEPVPNQILQEGYRLFLIPYGQLDSYSRINKVVVGDHPSPTPSTYTTGAQLEQPLSYEFTRLSPYPLISPTASPLNGYRLLFTFQREGGSGTADITELAVNVITNDGRNALLSRVVGSAESPLHVFSASVSTTICWELSFLVT